MRTTFSSIITLLLSITVVFAQPVPIKWGDVSLEDLKMTTYEQDPDAKAVVLTSYGDLKFNFLAEDGEPRFELKVHKRIKLLDKAGFDEADVRILYYSKNKSKEIIKLKAHLFTPDGQCFPVKNKDVFTEKVRDNVYAKKFTFPNLKEGAVIEYTYTVYSRDLVHLEEWYFQENIPVRWSELRLEIPTFYRYIFLAQGRAMDISEQDEYSASITFPKYEYSIASEQYERRGSQLLDATIKTYRLVQQNVPALEKEAYITTMDDYVAKIEFQLNATEMPDGPRRSFLTDWKTIADMLLKEESFGLQFDKKGRHSRLWAAAKPVVEQGKTPLEKITLAYNFINKNIQWNEVYSYSVTENNLDVCFEQKQATSGELNLMLLAILREAGIDAQPVLTSTRSHGKLQALYPILDQFNHAMVLVTVEDQSMLLDAGNPFRPIGYPRVDALNYQAWTVHRTEPEWISLTAPKAVEKTLVNGKLDEAGTLEGTIANATQGYDAVSGRRSFYKAADGSAVKETWMKLLPNMTIKSLEVENKAVSDEAFKVNIACELPNQAQVMNDLMYFSPAIYKSFEENPFKLDERVYPVEIPYPFSKQFVFNLELPEGYTVEELPEAARVVLPNKGGSFLYMAKANGNKLQIMYSIKVNQLKFSPEEYAAVKTFFDLIVEKNEAQVVLKKIQP